MAATYRTPGVYVEEISVFPPSVAEVETAIPAFVGYTEKATRAITDDLQGKPTRVKSLTEYEQWFGGGPELVVEEVQIDDANNFVSAKISTPRYLYDSIRLFFDNGGGPCYVVSVGRYDKAIDADELKAGVESVKKFDEPTILLFPDAAGLAGEDDLAKVQQAALKQCGELGDRVAVLDTRRPDRLGASFRNKLGINHLKYGAAYAPWLRVNYGKNVGFAQVRDKIRKGAVAVLLENLTTNVDLMKLVDDAKLALNPVAAKTTADNAKTTADNAKTTADTRKTAADTAKAAADAAKPAADAAKATADAAKATADTAKAAADAAKTTADAAKATADTAKAAADAKKAASDAATADAVANPADLEKAAAAAAALADSDAAASASAAAAASSTAAAAASTAATAASTAATATSTAAAAASVASGAAKAAYDTAKTAYDTAKAAYDTAKTAAEAAETSSRNAAALAGANGIAIAESNLLSRFGVYANLIKQINNTPTLCPPSGAIVGIYASVDNSRGVWKAPANVSLNGVIEPSESFDLDDTDGLNVDPDAGKSINAILAFAGKGTLVWGARTLAGNDNEWRYVPVRRFFNMVEESVKKSTSWAVFEPNDANTWVKVRGMIENYLTQKWREGALAGATTKEAFFVRCGLGVTMNAQDVLNGRMVVEIGMAVVRPAEFIILKFSHKLQTS